MPASRKKSKSGLTPRLLRWSFQPKRMLIIAACSVMLVLWPSVKRRMPVLEQRPEYRVTVDSVTVTPPPRWVPEDLVQRIFQRAQFGDDLSLQDPELSEKIALAFHTHPWIEKLERVRKTFPARVHVDVRYRRPVAMVEVPDGGYRPIDRFGVLLPDEDFSVADIDRYPLIQGVSSHPMRRGQSWGDPAVSGAAELAAVLTQEIDGQTWWQSLNLASIQVPRQVVQAQDADLLKFRMKTIKGTEIVWGRRPSTRYPGALTVAQKIGRLAEYHRLNGFDSGPAPLQVDITDWQSTRWNLLAESDERSELH